MSKTINNLSLHTVLKSSTKALHAEAERTAFSNPIETLEEQEIHELLGGHFLFVSFTEEVILKFPAISSFYQGREKLPSLRSDLENLGIAILNSEPEILQFNINSEAEVKGLLYVLEGSTLGGMILKKRISELFKGTEISYFGIYGKETGKRWKEFLDFLAEVKPTDYEAVLKGAVKGFELFIEFINKAKTQNLS